MPVTMEVMWLEDARTAGAPALFAGKYDETVAQIDAIIQDFQRRLYR